MGKGMLEYIKKYRHYPSIINQNDIQIKKVIYNGPATTIIWSDGIKTTVKCHGSEIGGVYHGDIWDPEKGLAMAFMKRFMTYSTIKKFIPRDEDYEYASNHYKSDIVMTLDQ